MGQEATPAMNPIRTLSVLALVALPLTAVAAAGPDAGQAQPPLTLEVGASKVLDLGEVDRVAVGDPQVADIRPVASGQLLVVGVAAGTTTLRVWNKKQLRTWQITVTPPAPPPANAPAIALKVGQVVSRHVEGLERLAIGDPSVADVKPAEDAVELTGRAAGQTTLIVWGKAGRQELRIDVTK
jgi:pilus assembly protein CpaC